MRVRSPAALWVNICPGPLGIYSAGGWFGARV